MYEGEVGRCHRHDPLENKFPEVPFEERCKKCNTIMQIHAINKMLKQTKAHCIAETCSSFFKEVVFGTKEPPKNKKKKKKH